tara:strand:- start:948 stop:1376 length:429 start_codon:yes stop_codon:yes gene_type:complete
MDLSELDVQAAAENGAAMQLMHPATGEPLEHDGKPITITLMGADSAAFRRSVALAMAKQSKARDVDLSKATGEEIMATFDKGERAAVEHLLAVTIGWDNIVWEGEVLPFSRENAAMVYSRHRWIRDQANKFIGDRTNYLGNG